MVVAPTQVAPNVLDGTAEASISVQQWTVRNDV